MALTKITSTNIGANAVTSALIANVSSSTITTGLGYTPVNKAGDSITGGGYLDFVSSSNRSIVGIRGTGFGYDPTSYEVLQVGRGTLNESVAIAVDPSAVSGGSFTGNGKEVCFPNSVSFITPNSGGTDWLAPMRLDSSGRITTPLRPAFSAYSGGDTVADGNAVPYATTDFNVGSCYNTSTYRFTAPVAGVYCFIWSNKGTNGQTYYTRLQVNGSARGAPSEHYANIANPHMHASAVVSLAVNDYVWIRSGSNYTRSDSADYFSGYLLG